MNMLKIADPEIKYVIIRGKQDL